MSQENFTVRHITSADEVAEVFHRRRAKLHPPRNSGALDYVSFFAADKTGFYAGELDGIDISCISVVKYSSDYAFVGCYVVDEPYRGKGYGLRTWKAALSSLSPDCNIALDAHEKIVPKYTPNGFKSEWTYQRMVIKPSEVSIDSLCCNTEGFEIKPATEIAFEKLLEYDTSVYVYARPSFLEKWISASNCHSYVAVSTSGGEVVGYAVVRSPYNPEDSWMIAPLFADDSQVARSLYKSLILGVMKEDPNTSIKVDVPCGEHCNRASLNIVTELSAVVELTLHRMYKRGIPSDMPLTKIFGVTSPELG